MPLETQKLYGIIPRAINDIFTIINQEMETNKTQFSLRVNYYEIYNEKFNDLLSKTEESGKNLTVRTTPNQGVIVVNDNPYDITGFEDFFAVLRIGN